MNLKQLATYIEGVSLRSSVNESELDDGEGLAIAVSMAQQHYTIGPSPCGEVVRALSVGPTPSVREARGALADALAALPRCSDNTPADALLSLDEAAKILGYTASGLRKIVNRTKQRKTGPAIQFSQIGRGPIKFRREWLDEFIASTSVETPKPRPRFKPSQLPAPG